MDDNKPEKSEDLEKIKKAVKEGGKEVLTGLQKAKKSFSSRLVEGVVASQLATNDTQDDMEKIKTKSMIMGAAVVKGTVEAVTETVSGIGSGGKVMKKILSDKSDPESSNTNNDDYEVTDDE